MILFSARRVTDTGSRFVSSITPANGFSPLRERRIFCRFRFLVAAAGGLVRERLHGEAKQINRPLRDSDLVAFAQHLFRSARLDGDMRAAENAVGNDLRNGIFRYGHLAVDGELDIRFISFRVEAVGGDRTDLDAGDPDLGTDGHAVHTAEHGADAIMIAADALAADPVGVGEKRRRDGDHKSADKRFE